MTEAFSEKPLDRFARKLVNEGAVEFGGIPTEGELGPEVELSGEEIGFKLDPELYIILKDFSDISGKPINVILQEAFKYAPEEAIVQYQTTNGLTWDEACNSILGDYLEQAINSPIETKPKIYIFPATSNTMDILKVLSLVYVTSLADQVDTALNLYLRDMKEQDIAQPQTLSAENHPIIANLKLSLTPDQETQFKYLANSLGCELPYVLHIIVDHLLKTRLEEPQFMQKVIARKGKS